MNTKVYRINTLKEYKFVVVLSEYQGKILLSRHKDRTTWETQGGHIEPGETPLAAAKRELYEESGAIDFTIEPLCDYWAGNEETRDGANGMVFAARILSLGAIPDSEMAEVKQFEELPDNLTYAAITPKLFATWQFLQKFLEKTSRSQKTLLYGTGNPAKLASMQRRLAGLAIEVVGLKEVPFELPEAEENGVTPLENAGIKARAYYQAFGIPVFSCDSGLYFDNVPEEVQPGVHVRTVNGKYLTDEEMLAHYAGLAEQYGNLTARYRNAISLVLDEEHCYEAMEENMASEPFVITSKPHPMRKKGFPLDSLSIDIKTGKYYYDLEASALDQVAVEDGFLEFFQKAFKEA
ncbi:MAG: NUDIX domain-containing protein [Lachnospiraceae bacterium]|nr:NUDIX domain-containing protein [Lachnospiraceae bacterium]